VPLAERVCIQAGDPERPLVLGEELALVRAGRQSKEDNDGEQHRRHTLNEEQDPPGRDRAVDVGDTVGDQAAERARKHTGADEERETLADLVLLVPERVVQGDGLAEESLADANEEPADDDRGKGLRAGHACRGDGPDESAEGNRSTREPMFGKESAGNRENNTEERRGYQSIQVG
jgi:hypothetical protein